MKTTSRQEGFTLIESVIAIAILTIGILALYSMQTAAINGNGHANQLTTSANWASDRAERILGADYTSAILVDADGDGLAGLDDTVAAGVVTADILVTQNAAGNDVITNNGAAVPANNSIPYFIYYNVAVDAVTPNTLTIRVITTWNDNRGQQKRTVVDYVKPRVL